MNEIIKAVELYKYYGTFKALDNISFSVSRGEVFCLLGANGSGKTTIIKLLLGLLEFGAKDKGDIIIDGRKIRNSDERCRIKIGYVPESRVLIENLTGEEFIDFIGKLNNADIEGANKIKDHLLKLFNMYERKNHMIKFYSNGMKKKILIISALVSNPDILIADEPFAALDPESIYIVKKLFSNLAEKGCTVFISSHTLDVIDDIADSVLVLNEGKSLFSGKKECLFEKCRTKTLEESYIKLIKGISEVRKLDSYIQDVPYKAKNN